MINNVRQVRFWTINKTDARARRLETAASRGLFGACACRLASYTRALLCHFLIIFHGFLCGGAVSECSPRDLMRGLAADTRARRLGTAATRGLFGACACRLASYTRALLCHFSIIFHGFLCGGAVSECSPREFVCRFVIEARCACSWALLLHSHSLSSFLIAGVRWRRWRRQCASSSCAAPCS